ncbi:MAG: hypothetical protein H0U55_04515 [Rubrobacteraceae bacterium]|nr:hypothetical protein [Rubrobacteraceae bacterium]
MRLAASALTAVVALLLFSESAAFATKAGCVHDKPCIGSSAGDRIMGTNGDDRIMARGGRDLVDARGGSDVVHGEASSDGDEYASGGLFGDSPKAAGNSRRDGDDRVYGDGGRDMLYGFGGSDVLVGGGEADYIFAVEFLHLRCGVSYQDEPSVRRALQEPGHGYREGWGRRGPHRV